MIFIHDRNRILKSSDTREENGKYKKLSRGKQKIKFYGSDKIENLTEELSENRKK